MKAKIVDMSVSSHLDWWRLHVPIKTGSISIEFRIGENTQLDEFLNNVVKLPSRRFGETPE